MALFYVHSVIIGHLVIISLSSSTIGSDEVEGVRSIIVVGGCPSRTYLVSAKNETICRSCKSCPAGYGVEVPCSRTSDTVCEACPEGTYNPWPTLRRRCRTCRRCSHPHVSVRTCRPERDANCDWCERGYYFDIVMKECIKCAYCFPEIPRLTTKIEACDVAGVEKEYRCIQISDSNYWEFEAKLRREKNTVTTTENVESSTLAAILDTVSYTRQERRPENDPTFAQIVILVILSMMLVAMLSTILFCVCKGKRKADDKLICDKDRPTTSSLTPVSVTSDIEEQKLCA